MISSASVQAYNRIIALHFPSSAKWTPHSDSDNFKIIAIDGCALVFGSLPFSSIKRLSKLVPKKSVMDPYVARLAGANLAAGRPVDLNILAERLKPEALLRTRTRYASTNLSDAAITWLATGEHGAGSEAMFYRLAAVLPPNMDESDASCHPLDSADLAHCRKLLEQVPELAERFPDMATVSPAWARLTRQWEQISTMMDQETPQWRESVGAAPKTCEMIESAIEEP